MCNRLLTDGISFTFCAYIIICVSPQTAVINSRIPASLNSLFSMNIELINEITYVLLLIKHDAQLAVPNMIRSWLSQRVKGFLKVDSEMNFPYFNKPTKQPTLWNAVLLKKPIVQTSMFALHGVLCCCNILALACINKLTSYNWQESSVCQLYNSLQEGSRHRVI